MRNDMRITVWTVLLGVGLALTSSVQAQQDTEAGTEAKKERTAKSSSRRAVKEGKGETAKLRKLRTAMLKSLELNRKQRKAVEGHFSFYFSYGVRNEPTGSGARAEQRRPASRMRSSRDPQAGKFLSEFKKMRDQKFKKKASKKSRDGSEHMTSLRLLDQLENELDEDQKKRFARIVKKLDINRTEVASDVPLKDLRSALRSSSLRLSNNQRAAITSLLRDGMASEAQARRFGDDDRAEEIANTTREAVFAELTEVQAYKLKDRLQKRAGLSSSEESNESEAEPDNDAQKEDEGDEDSD